MGLGQDVLPDWLHEWESGWFIVWGWLSVIRRLGDAAQEKRSGDQASVMCCRGEFWEVEFIAEASHYMTFIYFCCFYCVIKKGRDYTHTEIARHLWYIKRELNTKHNQRTVQKINSCVNKAFDILHDFYNNKKLIFQIRFPDALYSYTVHCRGPFHTMNIDEHYSCVQLESRSDCARITPPLFLVTPPHQLSPPLFFAVDQAVSRFTHVNSECNLICDICQKKKKLPMRSFPISHK